MEQTQDNKTKTAEKSCCSKKLIAIEKELAKLKADILILRQVLKRGNK